MTQIREKLIENYFQYFLLIVFLFLFLYLIYPFLFVILFALAIVISSYPLYLKVLKVVKKPVISASFMLILLSIIIVLPTFFITAKLVQDGVNFYSNNNSFEPEEILKGCEHSICSRISENLNITKIYFEDVFTNLTKILHEYFYSILYSITSFGIQIFIFYVCLFYFYLDKENFVNTLKTLLPLKTQYKEALILKFKRVCSAVFLDSILIAMMQGTLVGIGFYIFGLPSGIVWGIIASFLALLPFIGSGFVWGSASLYLLISGNIFAGIGFLLYGLIIVASSDNLVRPLLLKKSIHVHPFLILLSIMGGIEVFGFVGIFYGPIIISMLVAVIDLFEFEFK